MEQTAGPDQGNTTTGDSDVDGEMTPSDYMNESTHFGIWDNTGDNESFKVQSAWMGR
jgi:hypothetical protein